MKKIKVGYVRLYNARGCSILGGEEFVIKFVLNDIDVHSIVGPKFRHIIMTGKFKREYIDEKLTTRAREVEFPSPEIFPADVYTELIATRQFSIDDDLAEAFLRQDKKTCDEIFKMVEQSKHIFTKALDYAAGALGIRFHHQLVNTPITEQLCAYRGKDIPYSFQSGFKVKTIPSYKLDISENNKSEIKKLVPRISSGWDKDSEVLGWMLRAWETNDIIPKFVSLFTALECVIPGIKNEDFKKFKTNKNKLVTLVKKNSHASEKKILLEFLEELKAPNISLANRFEGWSSSTGFPGWKSDTKAFQRFNRMRNLLLHQGKSEVVEVEPKDIRTLENIAKRYVNLALFGDSNV